MQMKIQTNIKARALTRKHNESQVRDAAPGLEVKTNLKAGYTMRKATGTDAGQVSP
jgi:hypothetical protein